MAASAVLKQLIKASAKKGNKPDYGKIRTDLERISRGSGDEAAEAKTMLKEIRDKDVAATRTQKIKQSASSRKQEVTLPNVAGMEVKQKGKKISFYDEETGEVFEMSKDKYDSLTPRQRVSELNNMKARSRLGEDLSDEGMAKQNKKRAAAAAVRKKKTGGSMKKKTTYKKAGSSVGKKPRGCGAAQRGYGKAMMCGGRVKGKK